MAELGTAKITPEDCLKYKYVVDKNDEEAPPLKSVVGLNLSKAADYIIQETNMVTLIPEERMLYFHEGIYVYGGENLAKKILQDSFGRFETSKGKYLLGLITTKEILEIIKTRTFHEIYVQTAPERIPFFDSNPDIINMANGLYNWRTGDFTPHPTEYRDISEMYPSKIQIPIIYDPDAVCPTIEEINQDILQPKDLIKWYEWIGYCMYRRIPIQKAMVLFGPAGTGKSQLLDELSNMIGQDNIASISFQDLGGKRPDPYATAQLYGKLLSNVGDMDSGAVPETGRFKMITSGSDMIKARDIYEKPFMFINFAKLIMSANELPFISDKSNGFYRRIEIVDCLNLFKATDGKTSRLKAIHDPKELSGLFNKAISYLPALVERKEFTGAFTVTSVKDTYNRRSNPVEQFAVDCIHETVGVYTSKEDLYKSYLDYCDSLHIPHENLRAFGRRIKKIMGWTKADEKQKTTKTGLKWCWMDAEVKMPDIKGP